MMEQTHEGEQLMSPEDASESPESKTSRADADDLVADSVMHSETSSPEAASPEESSTEISASLEEDQLGTEAHPISKLQKLVAEAENAKEPEPAGPEEVAEPVSAVEASAMATPDQASQAEEPPPLPVGDDPLTAARDVMDRLRARVKAQVLGRDEVIDLVLVALLADGHVLLEDFPGSGKTTLAKSLGTSILGALEESASADGNADGPPIVSFRRIQFTPDLLPSDVTGVSVFDAASHSFQFREGPIFAHVVLADEINRTSPKVQAAMLEAMAEKQVTVDNVTYPLDELFFVIATQNPLDLAGTYPLPVAQLDRFLFKIRMHHIDRDAELEVLESWRRRRDVEREDLARVSRDELMAARRAIDEHVAIDERIQSTLVDMAQEIRADDRVLQGCSTRSLVLMLPALQALAAMRGRDYVSADDLVTLAPRVLEHRLEPAPGLSNMDMVIEEALGRAVEGLSRSTLRKR